MISFNIYVLLADPCSATLVTGVKRDIQLLRRIDVAHFIASFETCFGTR